MFRESDYQAMLDNLRYQSGPEGVVEALQKAAALTEHAAYEIVRMASAQTVAELILTAARLERISQFVAQKHGLD